MTENLEEKIQDADTDKETVLEKIGRAYLLADLGYQQAASIVQHKYQMKKKELIKKKDDFLKRRKYR